LSVGRDSGLDAPPDVVLKGRFTEADRERYSLVPFEVPAGHRQMHVRYSYTDRIDADQFLSGGNTLDIGIFDSRGTETGSVGFRGWSGSDQLEFVIGEEWATPPYTAGLILQGTWNVLLGPYKVGPRGCDWSVEVRFDRGVATFERDLVRRGEPSSPSLPPARPGWLRGDLHCHTRYSDGDSWPSELLHAATEAGLEFLGVTDHNTVAHLAEYGPGGHGRPIVIPGVEVTTYGGHWNAWGTHRWWEFRTPEAPAVEEAMQEAAAAGAFVSVNHPKPYGPAWLFETVRSMHAVEVWNGPWSRFNSAAVEFWEQRIRLGQRLVAVGGSDTHVVRRHNPDPLHTQALGMPTTWVEAGAGADSTAIIDAMRAGRTFVSAGPAGPQLYLEPKGRGVEVSVCGGAGRTLSVLGDRGALAAAAVESDDWSTTVTVPRDATYVRAQLATASGEIEALTSALWWPAHA
jgi:PHP domain-containing protein